MSMNIGGGSALRSEINITPLVDVVLVLLIIFMVVSPMMQVGYDVKVPPKAEDTNIINPPPTTTDQIIVRIDVGERVYINKEQIPDKDFTFRLQQAIQGQESTKVVFFAADGALPYEKVVNFLDRCREIGAQNIGIVLEEPASADAASGG